MKASPTALLGSLFALLVAGCVHRAPDTPLTQADTTQGYYFHTHPRTNNSKHTLLILCFSGGGTRAAALAYGVLEELRRTPVLSDGVEKRLLDEVDVISSVSGGSVTAAAYALYGEQLFERFEPDFLSRNVQRQLVGRVFNPFRWNRLCSTTYGRSDLAADLYDELLFHGATYADLADRPGPFTVLNATDISTGSRFSFTQYQFDLICSDLSRVRLSKAVAASSAVPGLLSPVTFDNRAGRCGSWIEALDGLQKQSPLTNLNDRASFHLREVNTYLDSTNRPYLHLVDGGVSDNLGVRSVLDGLFAIEAIPSLRTLFDLEGVDRIGIIVVNAFAAPEKDWDRREQPPGTLQIVVSGATIPMDRYSYETTALLHEQILRWRDLLRVRRGRDPTARDLRFFSVDVSVLGVEDAEERRYLLNQPTTFWLSKDAIDRLRANGGALLRRSKEFQAFLKDFNPQQGAP